MNNASAKTMEGATAARTMELFREQQQNIIRYTDRLFSRLMILQWLFAIAVAVWISPALPPETTSRMNPRLFMAVFLGGMITALPVYLALNFPGRRFTRHVIAVTQMLMSSLLIDLTGGRIQTHFHIFGSLAILAFYRDWRVLVSATAVVAVDNFVRGILWPETIYGVAHAPLWVTFEHAGWVVFEVAFLFIAMRKSLSEMQLVAERQAKLEAVNEDFERKVAERTEELERENRERRESQALYHSLVEQLPAGIFRKDAEGRYVLVNTWFCNLCGIDPNEVLGKTPAEIAQSGSEGPEAQMLNTGADNHKEIMRSGTALPPLEERHDINGKSRYVQVIKTPVFGADGQVIGSQGILADITERKRAEAALDFEKFLLGSLLDNSDDRIYFKDGKSKFIRCSSSMKSVFGAEKAEDLIGKTDRDFFSDEHANEAYEDEQKIVSTGEPLIGKIEKETWPDGRVSWVLTTKMPLRDKAGKIAGTFGVSKDITAIKEAETKIAEINRQLVSASRQAGMAEVATSVLHNVGNVLNSVNVSSSLIADKVRNSKTSNVIKVATLIRENSNDLGNFFANDPKGKQLPDYLAKLAERLGQEQDDILKEVSSLVSNIVHIKEIVTMQQGYAKTAGIMELLKPTDLMEDALRMNSGAVSRHNIKIVKEFNDLPPVLTDKHKVLQVLINLIRNAKYACDDSGREDKQITLRVWNGGGRVKIAVADNGIGIPSENLTRIFNHGFTTRKEGHGFGLHSGALAAKELGGALIASSEGVGQGATFTLELPASQQQKKP